MLILLASLAFAAPPDGADGSPQGPHEAQGPKGPPTGPHWTTQPYARPIFTFGAVNVAGGSVIQLVGGGEGGFQYRWSEKPHWLGTSRAVLTGIYGLNSGSFGARLAVGSFLGPDGKWANYEIGPDVWYDFYGSRQSIDYYLPGSPGVTLHDSLTLKVSKPVQVLLEADPSWVGNVGRRSPDLDYVDELMLLGGLVVRSPYGGLLVGWQQQWTAAGPSSGPVLQGGF